MRLKLAVAAALFSTAAQANTLIPGPGEFSPDLFAGFPGGSIVASILDAPWASVLGCADVCGDYSTWVVRTGAGTLDFVYKFDVASTARQDVNRVTASSFGGFATDVGDAGLGIGPTTVDRTTANPIGFNFATGIAANEGSNFLLIDTNARLWDPGHFSLINNGTSTVAAFEPAVPEPSTWALTLLGFGLLSFAGGFRKRLALY
jgi:hypothetical protein